MINQIVKWFPWVALVVFSILYWNGCNNKEISDKLYSASQDSLKTSRNEKGEQEAKIAILVASSNQQLIDLATNDTTIKKLQNLVKSNKNAKSATILGNTTSNVVSGNTSVSGKDTIRSHDTVYIYPEYSFSRVNRWENFLIKMNKDSTSLKYKIFNDFDLLQSMEKPKGLKNIFKDPIFTSSVVNHNPMTVTNEFRTYTTSCDCHNGKYFLIGNATGGIGAILLMKLFSK